MSDSPEHARRTILVVEDERDIRSLVRYNLEQDGFAVVETDTGDRVAELVRAVHPALVILDLMLPGLPGLEVCRALRQDPATADLPIVVLTARAAESDRIVGLEAGADDYVTKPFSPRELVARVRAPDRGAFFSGARTSRLYGNLIFSSLSWFRVAAMIIGLTPGVLGSPDPAKYTIPAVRTARSLAMLVSLSRIRGKAFQLLLQRNGAHSCLAGSCLGDAAQRPEACCSMRSIGITGPT